MHDCIICGEPLGEDSFLMMCSQMPAGAQDIPLKNALDKDSGIDLRLCQCTCCGLVQFDCEPVPYYRDVIRASSYSSTMAQLRQKQFSHFIELCGLKKKKIIEIGCGQGEFLSILEKFPVEAFGIENKLDLVLLARSSGLRVSQGFAESSDTTITGAPYDAFLSINFLEHQPNPNGMLRCIYNNLTKDGVGLITVPNLDYILACDRFYELLRDHIANYSMETLEFLLNRNGFVVLEKTVVNRDTLSVIVKKRPKIDIDGLKNNYDLLKNQMTDFVNQRIARGEKIAIWGASHQGFTAISTSGVGEGISYIIDSAPFKQGRFSPASHVPIVAPDYFLEEPVDCILIIAPSFTDEITGIIRERFGEVVELATLKSERIELI